jgi:hypothetical protein
MIITDQSVGSNVGQLTVIPFGSVVKFKVESVPDAFILKAVLKNGEEIVVEWKGSMDRMMEQIGELDNAEAEGGTYTHLYDTE